MMTIEKTPKGLILTGDRSIRITVERSTTRAGAFALIAGGPGSKPFGFLRGTEVELLGTPKEQSFANDRLHAMGGTEAIAAVIAESMPAVTVVSRAPVKPQYNTSEQAWEAEDEMEWARLRKLGR